MRAKLIALGGWFGKALSIMTRGFFGDPKTTSKTSEFDPWTRLVFETNHVVNV